MTESDLSVYGVVQSLLWGGGADVVSEVLGGDARVVVAAVKPGERPKGPFWPFALRGGVVADGGAVLPDEFTKRLGVPVPDLIRRILASLPEILGVQVGVDAPEEAKEAPSGEWVGAAVKVVLASTTWEIRVYLRPEGVEAIARAFREVGTPKIADPPGDPQADQGEEEGPVRDVRWPPFSAGEGSHGGSPGLELFYDVPLTVTAELGRVERRVEDVMAMGPGAILELDRMVGESVDLFVNGQWIARGEVVVVEDNFGVRITEIGTAQERVSKLRLREGS